MRYLTGRATYGEPWSPSFLLESAAAAAADRRLVVQRYRVTVVPYLARQYRAVRRYYVALQAHRSLRSLRHTTIFLSFFLRFVNRSTPFEHVSIGFECRRNVFPDFDRFDV